jgi:hypothetical protein
VHLEWNLGATCQGGGAQVERLDPSEGSWRFVPQAPSVQGQRVEYVDQDVVAGRRYGYRLATERCGRLGEIWIDWESNSVSLRAEVRPNPAVGHFNVAFDLPRNEGAMIELWDLQGRRVEAREVGSLGPGSHSLALGTGARMAPGV